MHARLLTVLYLAVIAGLSPLMAQDFQTSLRGKVQEAQILAPITQATLTLTQAGNEASTHTVMTDETGGYRFDDIPSGRYTLQVSATGYESVEEPGLVLHAGKQRVLDIELPSASFATEEVLLIATNPRTLNRVSTRTITVEETKRFAAVYFDPARMATSFPGVVGTDDQANNLVIRGNSPNGMRWRLEGMDIVNPNHLTNAGTQTDRLTQNGGGTILVSSQMLDQSTFSTGAFSAEYGNALSGLMDMQFRNGNNERYEFTGQIGLIGIDLSAEGPISKASGSSFLANYRYSTVGLITSLGVDFGDENIQYQDLSFKVHVPTERAGVFSIWAMGGLSSNVFTSPRPDTLTDQKEQFDIDFASNMGAIGVNHQLAIGSRTLWKSGLAASGIQSERSGWLLQESAPSNRIQYDELINSRISFRTAIAHQLNDKSTFEGGVFLSQISNTTRIEQASLTEPELIQVLADHSGSDLLVEPYVKGQFPVGQRIQLHVGLHGMWLQDNGSFSLEPRFAADVRVAPQHKLRLAYGLHSQMQMPAVYYTTFEDQDGALVSPNADLGFTRAHHVVLGYNFQPTPGFVVKVEPYFQRMFNVPVSTNPFSTFSTLNLLEGYVTDTLENSGIGTNYGIDLSVEQWLTDTYYYLLSGSWYQANFRAADGVVRDARYNGRFSLAASGGAEFDRMTQKGKNKIFGVNARILYRGGFMAAPVDLDASREMARTIYDESNGFTEQLPDYARVDLRIIFKRNKAKFTRTFSFDIQNVLNTQNIAYKYYDVVLDEEVTKYQLGLIPLLSYRLEF
ncbi:TonB-dependent receptor [Pontibacter sp. G13]|uniref:TonB-dependent receptor n=1 Tax=Pontibacter sp. G13 TaxID=3074898 RepID=UPI002889418A|nr:TonB-dependent receptor [Pontibacter sp. G13]WNJ19811.1 TonB-dependent receptor [Pontibacter sp. G13]